MSPVINLDNILDKYGVAVWDMCHLKTSYKKDDAIKKDILILKFGFLPRACLNSFKVFS